MSFSLRSSAAVACAGTFVAALAHAQVPVKSLTKAEAEFAEPFSGVVAARELRDGRLLVADSKEKSVMAIDLAKQTSAKVGREGSGPTEYGIPSALFALPGDSSAIFDPLNSRYLLVAPDGKPVTTWRIDAPPPAPTGDGRGAMIALGGIGMTPPRAVDAKGNLYFEGTSLVMGPNGPTSVDSAPVMRYNRTTKATDTITYVKLPANNAQISSTGGGNTRNVSVRIGTRAPFAARDGWTVLPNGTVVVARVKDYHLDVFTAANQKASGPAVAFTAVKVGNAEKQEYRESLKNANVVGIMRTNDNGNTRTQAMTQPPPAQEPESWPDVKPPFSSTNVYARPNGEVWVARSRPASDDVPRYDVFVNGRLTSQVTLPRKTRLLGFGSGNAIYTVRSDEDDLQYVQRFRG
jgi:hypothetical protein